jgi:hypothetical protein
MLISMPHGTSTIFGAFQAILALLANGTKLTPSPLNYRVMKSSPAKSFVVKPWVFVAPQNNRGAKVGKPKADQGVQWPVPAPEHARNAVAKRKHRIKNL